MVEKIPYSDINSLGQDILQKQLYKDHAFKAATILKLVIYWQKYKEEDKTFTARHVLLFRST